MFLARFRKAIDNFAPQLGLVYRSMRDATKRGRPIETAYGFSLAGEPTMAASGWEAAQIAVFLELLETHDVVLDVGANIGIYSCLAASRGKQTIAFEPLSRNLKYLYRNLWDNGFCNVEVFPVGLAREPGLGRIYGYGGIASFVSGWGQAGKKQSTVVPLTSLDTVLADRFQGKKLLIKMDVEGFEVEVIHGATRMLSRIPKPTWSVEIMLRGGLIPGGINERFTETFEIFWEHGYCCKLLDSMRSPVEPRDVNRWTRNGFIDGETHNFLFVSNESNSDNSERLSSSSRSAP